MGKMTKKTIKHKNETAAFMMDTKRDFKICDGNVDKNFTSKYNLAMS